MARKVIWSHEATTDLESLAEYIARDSAFYAASFIQEIREQAVHLMSFLKEDASFLSSAILTFVNFL